MKKTVVLSVIFLLITVYSAFSLNIGETVKYDGREWTVNNINVNKTVYLCPRYDYGRFFNKSEWGWFYDSRCITVPLEILLPHKKTNTSSSPPVNKKTGIIKLAQNPKYLNTLPAGKFRKMYKEVTQIAVMHPTQENIKAYMYMTNFLRLKALVFAHSVSDYVMENPKYNMDKKLGQTSWSAFNFRNISAQNRKIFIKSHKDSMGLMVFIKNGCPYCMKQIPVLSWFKADYGVDVLLISMNGCPQNTMGLPCMSKIQAFYTYKIRYEPSIMLVIRQKGGRPAFYPVGSGLTNEESLAKRVYYYAGTYYNPQERYTDKNFLYLLKGGK